MDAVDSIEKGLAIIDRQLESKIVFFGAKSPKKPEKSQDSANLELLEKIWVIKNLVKELEFSASQPFAFQLQSIFYNLGKFDEKIGVLKSFINDTYERQEKQMKLNKSSGGSKLVSSLPGEFSMLPSQLEKVNITDSELTAATTRKDYAKNFKIIGLFESRKKEVETQFFANLAELLDKFVVVENEVKVTVYKHITSSYIDNDSIEESLTIDEFLGFLDSNLGSFNDNKFKHHLEAVVAAFTKIINVDMSHTVFKKSAITVTNTDDLLSMTLNAGSSKTLIDNLSSLALFHVELPDLLRRLLSRNSENILPKKHFYTVISVELLELITKYINSDNTRPSDAGSSIKTTSVILIKLIYILVNLKVFNRMDFHFLNLEIGRLTVNSSKNDFASFLKSLTVADENVWDMNFGRLVDYSLDKQLNTIINSIKVYLSKFDTYDMIFDELIDRFEVDFREVVAKKEEVVAKKEKVVAKKEKVVAKKEEVVAEKETEKPHKETPKRGHQRAFSGSPNMMESISESAPSIDSVMNTAPTKDRSIDALINNDLTTQSSVKINNRRSNIFALAGSKGLNISSNLDPIVSEESETTVHDKSFNQTALDSLVGKNNPTITTQTVTDNFDSGEAVTSPMSPVTPISPFDFSSNSKRFSNIEKKKPEDDRKRFSKRFSSIQQSNNDDSKSVDSDPENSNDSSAFDSLNEGVSLNRRASKRISKRLSKRFSALKSPVSSKSMTFDEESDLENDGWGNDDLDLDIEDGDAADKTVQETDIKNKLNTKRSSKSMNSFNSIEEELDDWGWGAEDDLDLDESSPVESPSKAEVTENNLEFKVSKFKSTKIPDEISNMIMTFVTQLKEFRERAVDENLTLSNEDILNRVKSLLEIFYLIGGYSKYDSKFLFYNDVYYLNIVLKEKLINLHILDNKFSKERLAQSKEVVDPKIAFKGPDLFDTKIEDYLTNIINLEKISFLRIYRKFQNFRNLGTAPAPGQTSTFSILTQLEFKFKEIFFAGGFQQLSENLRHIIIINFLNEFYQLIINDILQIMFISESDSIDLCKIVSYMLNFVKFFDHNGAIEDVDALVKMKEKDLTLESDETVIFFKRNITNYMKLANFKIIINSHLASIMENFYNGEFYNVETEELIHLIKALFVDSEISRNAIREIEEIRNISI